MVRVLLFLVVVGAAAVGVAWLADHPGDVVITWQGWRLETSVMVLTAGVALAALIIIALWSTARFLASAPAAAARAVRRRRQQRGLDAVMRGMVAVGAGDVRAAGRYAREAQQLTGNAPLTALLTAQA